MYRIFGAFISLIMSLMAGLAYPVFQRDNGKYFLLLSAFSGGAVLAAAGQSLSLSAVYSKKPEEQGSSDVEVYAMYQRVIAQFMFFLFVNYGCSYYFKSVVNKFYPQHFHDVGESTELLGERKEDQITSTIFDGSNDLFSSALMFICLSFTPFAVGLELGRSPYEHTLLLISYSLYRLCGSVTLCKTLDQRGTPGFLSWVSLGWYASVFPCGILLGSLFDDEQPTSALAILCSIVAASLTYDVVVEHLPRCMKSTEFVFQNHGDWNVLAACSLAIIVFLMLASTPPELTKFPPPEVFTPAPTAAPGPASH
jgi:hypothetical protein